MQTAKTYWAQVEGISRRRRAGPAARRGGFGRLFTQPAQVRRIDPPACGRARPIRVRQSVPDSWLEKIIHEGKTARCGA